MRKIWVLGGGPSTEFEVSLKSARVVCQRISLSNQKVRPVGITRSGRWMIAGRDLEQGQTREWVEAFFERVASAGPEEGASLGEMLVRLQSERPDCMFVALHGQFGEDGCVQGVFETVGVAYTGSGVLASALAFNKTFALRLLACAGLAVPKGCSVRRGEQGSAPLDDLRFPVFVKPVRGGSSVGMSLVHEPAKLPEALAAALAVDAEALIEERVEGIEVTCGVLDIVRDGKVESVALPPTELRPVRSEYFDFAAKYTAGETEEVTPPQLPGEVIECIQACALAAHRLLGCEGMSRTDMILPRAAHAEPVILETNTIPGMTPTSIIPQEAAVQGISFEEFLNILIEHALFRF